MSTEVTVGKVKQVKGQVKQNQAEGNQNPLGMLEGKRDELVGIAQEKYGQAYGYALRDCSSFAHWIPIYSKNFFEKPLINFVRPEKRS